MAEKSRSAVFRHVAVHGRRVLSAAMLREAHGGEIRDMNDSPARRFRYTPSGPGGDGNGTIDMTRLLAAFFTALTMLATGQAADAQGRERIGYGWLATNDIFGDLHDRWQTGSVSHLQPACAACRSLSAPASSSAIAHGSIRQPSTVVSSYMSALACPSIQRRNHGSSSAPWPAPHR